MIIKNGTVFGPHGQFEKRTLYIEKDLIVNSFSQHDENQELDATDLYVIPGLTDLHFHGCMGADFCDGTRESLDTITAYQLHRGVTTICPTSMTYGEEKLTQIFGTAAGYANPNGSEILGIHMEGPFLSKDKAGAQNKAYLQTPDVALFRRLQQASDGRIRICDIAPELDGAMEFIQSITGNRAWLDDGATVAKASTGEMEQTASVHISLAHTAANYEIAMQAFGCGADHVTHLYNGMLPFHHREPGVIGAAYMTPAAYTELIADGIHCLPAVIKMTLQLYGDDRIIFISDSMRACGMPDGIWELGGQRVDKKGNQAHLQDGTIAGSVVDLMTILQRNVTEFGIALETVVKCCAVNPIKSLGLYEKYGSLEAGKKANLVLLDRSYRIRYVIKDGCIVK